MKNHSLFPVGAILIAVMSGANAQSSIRCEVNEKGVAVAPLIWQNTLGVARANSLCADTQRHILEMGQKSSGVSPASNASEPIVESPVAMKLTPYLAASDDPPHVPDETIDGYERVWSNTP